MSDHLQAYSEPPLPILVGSEKNAPVDQGFCLVYFRLSYRRKLIRTLWTLAFSLIILFLPAPRAGLLFSATLLIGLIQAGYNYVRWQAEVKQKTPQTHG